MRSSGTMLWPKLENALEFELLWIEEVGWGFLGRELWEWSDGDLFSLVGFGFWEFRIEKFLVGVFWEGGREGEEGRSWDSLGTSEALR